MRDDHSLRLLEYIYNSTSILNFGALFSDGTENYCSPSEPDVGDDITLRFRTAGDNVDGESTRSLLFRILGARFGSCFFRQLLKNRFKAQKDGLRGVDEKEPAELPDAAGSVEW